MRMYFYACWFGALAILVVLACVTPTRFYTLSTACGALVTLVGATWLFVFKARKDVAKDCRPVFVKDRATAKALKVRVDAHTSLARQGDLQNPPHFVVGTRRVGADKLSVLEQKTNGIVAESDACELYLNGWYKHPIIPNTISDG